VLFGAGDPSALAGAVTRVLDDADLRRVVVKGGLETARELDVDRLADTLEEWHLAARSGRSARDRAQTLAAAGVTRIPLRDAADDRDRVVAALLRRARGPVLDLTADDRTLRVDGAPVRAASHALPFRDHAFAAVAARADQATAELARVVRAGGPVVVAAPNRWDARLAQRRILERLRLGPEPTRRSSPPLDAHFEIVARHAVAWADGGRKRALASRLTRLGPLRRFGPATVVELRPRRTGGSAHDANPPPAAGASHRQV
jgi:hypothetical protein